MAVQPVPRQPACQVCAPHEAHMGPCEWCTCSDVPVNGIYADPWPPYLGD